MSSTSLLRAAKRTTRGGAIRSLRAAVSIARLPARLRRVHDGVTVVAVNYRSLDALQVLVEMVRRHSAPTVRVLIVDNESSRETRAWMRQHDVSFVPMPLNVGHGHAMDLGWLLARTEFVVALDIDAFPVSDDWIDLVIDPLRSGYLVAGGRLTSHESYRQRPYVQPCYLAMRRSTFLTRKLSFCPTDDSDTGEAITKTLGTDAAQFIEQTEVRGPGPVGSVFGDAVYHNFYGTRFRRDERVVLDDIVHQTDADSAWADAVERWVVRDGRDPNNVET